MLTPTQADKLITKHLPKFGSQTIALTDSYGSIIDENILADRDMPSFDKALMDGIAIQFDAWKKGPRTFQLQGVQSAGQAPKKLKSAQYCFEITTGSVIPVGCDTVIPIERVTIEKNQATIDSKAVIKEFQNIQPRGSDNTKGAVVLSKGARMFAPQMAISASVGKTTFKIKSRLKVAVIATGDELKSISSKVSPYETRLSNSLFIKTALDETGLFQSDMFHIRDNPQLIFNSLKKYLNNYDVLVLSGGVSKGKFDYVPDVLKELHVKQIFHRIAQRPGGPMWFGISKNKVPVFALPGNPISTQVCLIRYVIPQLSQALGLKTNFQFVKLVEDVKITTDLTFFLPVRICQDTDSTVLAQPVYFERSGNLGALGTTDGFVELTGGQKTFKKGSAVRFFKWN